MKGVYTNTDLEAQYDYTTVEDIKYVPHRCSESFNSIMSLENKDPSYIKNNP